MQGLVGHLTRLHGKDVVTPVVLIGTGLIAAA
jgi:hypothetical protein